MNDIIFNGFIIKLLNYRLQCFSTYKLRYQIFSLEKKWENDNLFMEFDKYDFDLLNRPIYFGLYSTSGNLVASFRLIRSNLPLIKFKNNVDHELIQNINSSPNDYFEISRFIVDSNYRNNPEIVKIMIYSAFSIAHIFSVKNVLSLMTKELGVICRRVSKIVMYEKSSIIPFKGERIVYYSNFDFTFNNFKLNDILYYYLIRNIIIKELNSNLFYRFKYLS